MDRFIFCILRQIDPIIKILKSMRKMIGAGESYMMDWRDEKCLEEDSIKINQESRMRIWTGFM
jgi:hypothetical protein